MEVKDGQAKDARYQQLFDNFKSRNFNAVFCANRDEVHQKLIETIPENSSIGFCGSQTLEQLEIIEILQTRGNKVYNQYDPELSRDESMRVRKLGVDADFYLCSANAVAGTGELVFLSAYGQRIAGIAGASRVIVICGTNKITDSRESAIKRAREYATPLNVKRLHWDTPCFKDGKCHESVCLAPDYNRMCCQMLVLESEILPERLTVMIVGEELGF
ncbi:MAG: lactate utilization protein [Candidatus Omnitrophica bacterium]|jgi:hypothetical protein|nr:lactate utilization protein [Candidatus Omnitrophota bacterium]